MKKNTNRVSPLPEGWSEHKTKDGRSYYHNSLTGVSQWTIPPVQPTVTEVPSQAGPVYEEIPEKPSQSNEDEYDYIPDVHTSITTRDLLEKHFLPEEDTSSQEECYYNLKESPIVRAQSPGTEKSLLEAGSTHMKDTPDKALPWAEHGYYNLRDSSHSIPSQKSPSKAENITSHHPEVCEESDEDDREYYNGNLNLHEESDEDEREYYNSSLGCWLPTGRNPESTVQEEEDSSMQIPRTPVRRESLPSPSHHGSNDDPSHYYGNTTGIPSPQSETPSVSHPPLPSARLPPRDITRSLTPPQNITKSRSLSPQNVTQSRSLTPQNVTQSRSLTPQNVTQSRSLTPQNVTQSRSLTPQNVTQSRSLTSQNVTRSRSLTPPLSKYTSPKPPKPPKPPTLPKPPISSLPKSQPGEQKPKILLSRTSSSPLFHEPLSSLAEQNEQLREENAALDEEKERLWHRCSDLEEQLSSLGNQLERKTSEVLLLQQKLRDSNHPPPCTGPQTVEFWQVSRQDVHVFEHKILGRGAWGYVAEGKFRGLTVAVKQVYREILQPHTMERIQREISTMAQVRHPNLLLFIAAVLDYEGGPMIITEILDMSLRKAYENRRLGSSNTTRTRIFRDVASALNYLHEHREPILHRDVSSANVLLEALANSAWKAKLSDFGSANLVQLATTPGEGALVYAAPESFPQPHTSHTLPQTPKVDVYSYGVLLCEVIAQKFPEPSNFANMLRVVRRKWLSMHALITHCIKTKPEDRPAMTDVLDQLDKMPEFSYNY